MGRNKIEIKYIVEQRKRQVTLNKRKGGLMKKAYELSVLCGSEVTVLIKDKRGQSYIYSSRDSDETLRAHLSRGDEEPVERLDNRTMRRKYDSDATSESEDEDEPARPLVSSRGRKLPAKPSRTSAGAAAGTGSGSQHHRPAGFAGKGSGGKPTGGMLVAAAAAAQAGAAGPRSRAATAAGPHRRAGSQRRVVGTYDPDDYELDPAPDMAPARTNSGGRRSQRRSNSGFASSHPNLSSSLTGIRQQLLASMAYKAPKFKVEPHHLSHFSSSAAGNDTNTTALASMSEDEDDASDTEAEDTPDGVGACASNESPPAEMPPVGWKAARQRRRSLKVLTSAADSGPVPNGIVRRGSVMASDAGAYQPGLSPLIGLSCGGINVANINVANVAAARSMSLKRRQSVPSDSLNPILNSPSLALLGDVATPISAAMAGGFDGPCEFWSPWSGTGAV